MILWANWIFESGVGMTRKDIFQWWEARRLRYNALLLIMGIITCLLVLFTGIYAYEPKMKFEEPNMITVGPFAYGIAANIFYTFGPLIDVIFYRGRPRVKLFKTGLIFSLILTALPSVWAVTILLITVYTGKKL